MLKKPVLTGTEPSKWLVGRFLWDSSMDVVKGSSTANREKAAFLFSFFSFFFQILERHCILKVNENRGKLRIVTADSKFRVWKNEKKKHLPFRSLEANWTRRRERTGRGRRDWCTSSTFTKGVGVHAPIKTSITLSFCWSSLIKPSYVSTFTFQLRRCTAEE